MMRTTVHPSLDRVRTRSGRRPGAVWVLVVLLGLLVVSGFVGGLSFIRDATGASLGAKLTWLEHTPVRDFLLPGMFLLVVYGIGGMMLMAGLIWRPSPGPLRRVDHVLGQHWAWVGSVVFGAVLVLWIVYELFVLPDTMILQPVLITIGLAIAGLPFLPSVRRWYAVDRHVR
jgi:hypothetical protein